MENQVGIGIDIGGSYIKYGLVNKAGIAMWESQKPTKANTTRQAVEENIIEVTKEALRKAIEMGLSVRAIGVGTPGLVTKEGVVIGGADNIVDWEDVPLQQLIEEQLSLPTVVKNDADMMAIGEIQATKTSATTAIFITIGTGIGGAMIIHGQLFSGHFGMGGELGVFPIMVNGQIHNWEDVASTAAMVRYYQQKSSNNNDEIDGKYIVQKYLENEALAIETINRTSHLLGMGLAGYINVFNPEMVIIGGGISEAGDFFIEKIKTHIINYALEPCVKNVKIVLANLGNRAGMIGAGIFGLLDTNR